MYGKILFLNSTGDPAIELPNGDKVFAEAYPINQYTFECRAVEKNVFGLPMKTIWRLALVDSRGEKDGLPYTVNIKVAVDMHGRTNVIPIDFYEYPPKQIFFAYVLQFSSLSSLRAANNCHESLFDPGTSLEIALETKLLHYLK